MSAETSVWLNNNVLIGFTDRRGTAWHHRASDQGAEPNHYLSAIPVEDVRRRLFDWTVEAGPVLTRDQFGLRTVADKQAVIAQDTGDVLGVHGTAYGVHQYQDWLLDRVSTMLDSGLAIGSAGLLRGRRQAWVSVELPDTITTAEGVAFRPNVLACSSHDGSITTTYKRVVTNVVCDNTMTIALRESGPEFRQRHTRNSIVPILRAREALGIVHHTIDTFSAEVAQLCQTTVTDQQWREFLQAHVPEPEKPGPARTNAAAHRSTLTRLWTSDERVAPWQRTAWGVVQAVNTYAHHEKTVRGATRAERNMGNTITGVVDKIDRSTMDTLRSVLAAN